jgi:Tfp pilus assembly protein PilP
VQTAPLFAQPAPLLAQAGAAGSETGSGEAAQPAAATAPDLPEDPERWPLARLRLAGVWQQGADRQAVLVAGPHWVRVRPGQRVTLEGHRVQAISSEAVTLRAARGPVHVLHWEAGR